jgi:hypothetical protein
MDIVPLSVSILWIVGMVLDHTRFAVLWQRIGYRPTHILSLFQGRDGREKLRDFPFLGRVLFSAAVVVLAYGMEPNVLLSGVFFVLLLTIVHAFCVCNRKRFPYPEKPLPLTIRLTVALASVLEIIVYFTLITIFFAPYVLLSIMALRFLFTSFAVLILSPFIKKLS